MNNDPQDDVGAARPSRGVWRGEFLLLPVLGFIALFFYVMLNPVTCRFSPVTGPVTSRTMVEMRALETAIHQYESDYESLPASAAVLQSARESSQDFTYGLTGLLRASSINSNADLMAILMARERFPDGSPVVANAKSGRNPRKIRYLEVKMSQDNRSQGIGLDGTYRDRWGNPYIITLDLDGDGVCRDPVYSRPAVAVAKDDRTILAGHRWSTNQPETLEFPGRIMIWSLGPDGKADPTIPADQGVNRDNILSWQ